MNLGGFDGLNYGKYVGVSTVGNSSSGEDLSVISHINAQIKRIISTQTQLHANSEVVPSVQFLGDSDDIPDLLFVNKLKCNWNVFKYRLGRILDLLIEFIRHLNDPAKNAYAIRAVNMLYRSYMASN